jgi:hypothetical protein
LRKKGSKIRVPTANSRKAGKEKRISDSTAEYLTAMNIIQIAEKLI